MSAGPLIKFKNASIGYGRRAVLTHVEFEVKPGDFVGILGHNGSGKTTLLKTLLGLIPLLGGKLSIAGKQGPLQIGYVPQKEKLDPIFPLSAYEVAAMGTYRSFEPLARLRLKTHRDHIRAAMRDCGALELSERPYSALSGGQKQRVLIARALAAKPEVLVLDEPLAGIDITTQHSLLILLRELKGRWLTILMVSHRIQAEKDLFTHIAWVNGGKVEQDSVEVMLKSHNISKVFESEL